MRALSMVLVGALFMVVHATAQDNLKKVEGSGIHTSGEVYVNEKGEYFSKVFYIAFKKHVTEDIHQTKSIRSSNIRSEFTTLKTAFLEFERNQSLQQMERLYVEAIPNDTIRYNKKGEAVVIHDRSKRYKLVFEDIQSLKVIREHFDVPNVRYVEQPPVFYTTSNYPNDPYFDNQWTHKILESDKVFDITEGDPNIVIGISDGWSTSSAGGVHEEMDGRVIAYEHGKWVNTTYSHGPRITLIAAATTNNNTGIAGLGGNAKLVFSGYGYTCGTQICLNPGLPYIINLSSAQRPDILNMSWNGGNNPSTKDDLQDLLNLGVILVTAAGNDGDPPSITYPSGYTFNNGDQVISVTATQLTDDVWGFDPLEPPIDPFQYEERFAWQTIQGAEYIFDYGLDNDPINNPDSAFTDVAAPSRWIFTARGEYDTETGSQDEYRAGGGATSEAAPLVTSVVAMMLSVNPALKGDPQGVYDIITSTTEYDDIVVPSDAQTNTLPDGRKYNKYIGFGRINAYNAVLASVPKITNDVTSNTTWSGYVHLENLIEIDNNATLTIDPGTTVLLGDNVILRVKPGSKIIAEGTETEPIRFMRADPDKQWNKIDLRSSAGNSFEWVLFDGGERTVDIASKNNTLTHITSRNGWRGISGWHNSDGTGNSEAEISYALIEDNTSVGLVSHYLDLDLSYTTIRNNAQAGLYISSNTVYPFHNNLITNNGVTSTSRDGIEVKSSGTLYMHGDNMTTGLNKVADNADDQISNYGDLIVGASSGGVNHITGDYSGGKYLVGNYSSATVDAVYNYWGESYPNTNMFDPPVNYSSFMSSYYPVVHGHDGQAPAKALPEQGQPMTEEDIAAAYDEAENALGQAETNQQARDEIYALYIWSGLSSDSKIKSRFNNLIKEIADARVSIYSSGELNAITQNYAQVLYTKSLIRDDNYEEAQAFIKEDWDAGRLTGYDRRDYFHLKIVMETYHREYEAALATLEELYAYQQTQDVDMEEFRASYSTFEEDIRVRMEEAGSDTPKGKETLDKTDSNELTAQNYPNPFNPTTKITFTLPELSNVTLVVYDMLGREVARLVDRELPAAEHTYTFDASNLANGMYLYKLRANGHEIIKKMTLIK